MTSLFKLGIALFLFSLMTFQTSAQSCGIISNGDFELGFTGWTGGISPTATNNFGLFAVTGGNPNGALELNAGASSVVYANQTINTVAGVTYTVTGDYKGGALHYICPTTGVALQVVADGAILDAFSYDPTASPVYAPFSTTFIATGPTTVLTLKGQAVGDCSVVIDNVEVCGEAPPIPTMSQWGLFILGLSLMSMAVVTIRKTVLAVS